MTAPAPCVLTFHVAPIWLRLQWWRPAGAVTVHSGATSTCRVARRDDAPRRGGSHEREPQREHPRLRSHVRAEPSRFK